MDFVFKTCVILSALTLSCCNGQNPGESHFSIHIFPYAANQYKILNNKELLLCRLSVTDDNLKPTLSWEINWVKITSTTGRVRVELKEDNTLLLRIYNVQVSDEGLYRCVATLGSQTDSKSFSLQVYIPPIILDFPDVTNAVEGGENKLTCTAKGVPAPDVIWQKEGRIRAYKDGVRGSGPEIVPEDGNDRDEAEIKTVGKSMIFNPVKPQDVGSYICHAFNFAGRAEKAVKFEVKYKPNFNTDFKDTVFFGWKGHTANMTCLASANELATIQWNEQIGEHQSRIENRSPYTLTTPQYFQEYYLTSSSMMVYVDDDNSTVFKDYICLATNSMGESSITVTLRRVLPPGAPIVKFYNVLYTEVTLEVIAPTDNGGLSVIGYHYSYYTESDKSSVVERDIDSTLRVTSVELTDLKANTPYVLRTSARNAAGLGQEVMVAFQTDVVSSPLKLDIISPSEGPDTTTYTLKWSDPEDGGSPITQYAISYRAVVVKGEDPPDWIVSDDIQTKFTVELYPNPSARSYTIRGLNPNSHYDIRIIAENKEGKSPEAYTIIKTNHGRERPAESLVIVNIHPDAGNQYFIQNCRQTLACKVFTDYDQDPNLSWYINGVEITSTTDRVSVWKDFHYLILRIDNAQVSDKGLYKCVATLGSQTDSMSINVEVLGISSPDQFGIFGEDGEVKCEITANPPATITWSGTYYTNIENSTKHIVLPDRLLIKNLDDGDSSTYWCDIFIRGTYEPQLFRINFEVVHRPKIEMIPIISPSNPKEGDDEVKITCKAFGIPKPTYQFKKRDKLLPDILVDTVNGIMTLHNLKWKDEGNYTCVATNIGGSDQKSIWLDVKTENVGGSEVPFTIQITPNAANQQFQENMTRLLLCRVPATDDILRPTLSWEINGVKITSRTDRVRVQLRRDDGLMLRIYNVQVSDEGLYRCVATLGSQTDSKSISVQVVPQNVGGSEVPFTIETIPDSANQQFQLNITRIMLCRVTVTDDNRKPTLSWEINGVEITSRTDKFRVDLREENIVILWIYNVQVSDEGLYRCVATLGSQTDSRSISVEVLQELSVISRSNQYGTFGEDGEVKCETIANPPASITWRYNGTRIKSSTKHIILPDRLLIKNLDDGDSKTYQCDIFFRGTYGNQLFPINFQVVPDRHDDGSASLTVNVTGMFLLLILACLSAPW